MKIKRALLSVSDKSNLEELALGLKKYNVEIISSGGTRKFLEDKNIKVTPIEEVTGNPEAFGGRMKTLSFQIASSLLFRRDNTEDIKQAKELNIEPIDLVVCNLYPFQAVVNKNGQWDEVVENIDIGGPTMVRASAKNYKSVVTLTNPQDYSDFLNEYSVNGETSEVSRKKWAYNAFVMSSSYESNIANRWSQELEEDVPPVPTLDLSKSKELRYGENPHQKGWVIPNGKSDGVANAKSIQGKALSYNNLLDADASWRCLSDLNNLATSKIGHAVSIVKHSNPCGASLAATQLEAIESGWAGDKVSAFGSIICFNTQVTAETAAWLSDKFIEVVIAPNFDSEALSIFSKKKNLRILELAPAKNFKDDYMLRTVSGGFIYQQEDDGVDLEYQTVTDKKFADSQSSSIKFGTIIGKHLRSNAIVLVSQKGDTLSISGAGMGNPNRLISLEQAIGKAKENGFENLGDCILVSDAFFPFRDNIDLASKYGIKWIVQPGGSIRDKEVIDACNEFDIGMTYTGRRHFRH